MAGLIDKSKYEARTFRLPPDLLELMDEYADSTGISRTAIVEKAVRQYLNDELVKCSGNNVKKEE